MSLHADLTVGRDGFVLETTLDVEPGTTAAVLGPNGAGKTTLVRAIAGLQPIDRGTITLDGRVLDDAAGSAHLALGRRPVGLVPQDLQLFPRMSALDNAAFPLRARGMPKARARARASELLDRFGVWHRRSARPAELSGGEAQLVALARALAHEPRLLLLDEPLSALDARARPEIRALLRSALADFDGVRILVTHDPVEAMTLGDRLVILEDGRVTQSGTPEEIRNAPRTAYAAALVGLNLFRGRLEPIEPGAARLRTAGGEVIVSWAGAEAVGDALGLLRPADVSLYRARPEGSARNVLRGRITAITRDLDRVRISIDGHPRLVAEVTPGSVERLGLAEGVEVWASFKAMEVTVVPA